MLRRLKHGHTKGAHRHGALYYVEIDAESISCKVREDKTLFQLYYIHGPGLTEKVQVLMIANPNQIKTISFGKVRKNGSWKKNVMAPNSYEIQDGVRLNILP